MEILIIKKILVVMDTFDWTNLSQYTCPSVIKTLLLYSIISKSYCLIIRHGGDEKGRTLNKCLTPYPLCNLLELKSVSNSSQSECI